MLPAAIALALFLLALLCALTVAEWKAEADFARSIYAEVRRRPPHPFLQVLPAGQVGHVNEEGFRGDAITPAKPGRTFRIFTLGGSTTLGVNSAYEETYPFLVQQMLRARHPGRDIEVQNAALTSGQTLLDTSAGLTRDAFRRWADLARQAQATTVKTYQANAKLLDGYTNPA